MCQSVICDNLCTRTDGRFLLQLDAGREVQCGVVVVAVGLWEPNVPTDTIPGIEHATGCVNCVC